MQLRVCSIAEYTERKPLLVSTNKNGVGDCGSGKFETQLNKVTTIHGCIRRVRSKWTNTAYPLQSVGVLHCLAAAPRLMPWKASLADETGSSIDFCIWQLNVMLEPLPAYAT